LMITTETDSNHTAIINDISNYWKMAKPTSRIPKN
jgi:hypothetical protein